MSVTYFAQHPLPERQGLCMRVVDPENAYALVDPENHNVAQRTPEGGLSWGTGQGTVKVRIDDVLVALRRILRILQSAVHPPIEPVGMLSQPGMIRRTLNGKIQRNLEPVLMSSRHQVPKIAQCAQLGVHLIVPPRLGTDGIGAARVARCGGQRIVAAFPVTFTNWVYGWEVQDIEPHASDIRKPTNHIAEGSMVLRVRTL